MSIASVMPSIHLILWCPLLLPSIFPRIRVFSNELAVHIRWPNYGSFSISPSNKYSGLISLRIDWFDLLAVQGTQDSSPASQFEGIDSLVLCHLYGPTLTTICDYWEDYNPDYMDLVGRVTSLLFNTLSRFVMAFPAKKQSPSDFRAAVTICSDFRAQEEPICHYFHLFPSICCEVMRLDAMVLVFLILSFKPAFSLSSFTLIKRLFSSLLSAIRVVLSAYLRLLMFLLPILIPACNSSHFSWCAQHRD